MYGVTSFTNPAQRPFPVRPSALLPRPSKGTGLTWPHSAAEYTNSTSPPEDPLAFAGPTDKRRYAPYKLAALLEVMKEEGLEG